MSLNAKEGSNTIHYMQTMLKFMRFYVSFGLYTFYTTKFQKNL